MTVKHTLVVLLSVCLFSSCQTLMDMVQPILNPSASPEMVADIMAKADAVAFKSPKKLGKSGKSRMKIKKGQWVTTLSTHKDAGNDRVLSTTRVISVKGQTVVLETESYSAMDNGERMLAQMTIENYPVKANLAYTQAELDESIGAMKVVRVRVKNGDEPARELPAQALAMYQQMGKNLGGINVMSGELDGDACATSYIRSKRCYTFDFSVAVMGISSSGRVTVHSKIPVNGLVRMESESLVQETIAFGHSGAKSQF